jgi:hypothetical protein
MMAASGSGEGLRDGILKEGEAGVVHISAREKY